MPIKVFGLLLALGALQFMAVVQIASALYPGYSAWTNYISDLGNRSLAGPAVSSIFNSSALALGALTIASAYGLGRAAQRRALTTSTLALAGVGALGVGLFPEGTPHGLHTISALIAFLFGGLAVAFLGSYTPVPKALRMLGILMGAISLISLAAYVALGEPPIVERLIVYPILIYAAIYGLYVAARWA